MGVVLICACLGSCICYKNRETPRSSRRRYDESTIVIADIPEIIIPTCVNQDTTNSNVEIDSSNTQPGIPISN